MDNIPLYIYISGLSSKILVLPWTNVQVLCIVLQNFEKGRWECLVRIYVFPEMKLLGLVISTTELYNNVLSPNFNIHVSVTIYFPRIGLPIWLQKRQTDPGNI
jgi:hypothetical protein